MLFNVHRMPTNNAPLLRCSAQLSALCLVVIFSLLTTAFAKLPPALSDMKIKAIALQDFDSQEFLIEHNADERLEPASITKLMTAYVVYKALQSKEITLESKFTVSKKARYATGSRMFLEEGSEVSVNNLLKGLVIQSGNDAAITLAEGIAGTEEEFVKRMNQLAQAIGLKNSHFQNASGLPVENHYTTAKDIAKLASQIIGEFPDYYKTYKEKEFTWNNIRQPNRNRLLFTDPSVDGLKTGHTESAGYCLAASAIRDERRLVSVVLGANDIKHRTSESKRLLNYGFEHFKKVRLYEADKEIAKQAVKYGLSDSVSVTLEKPLELIVDKNQVANLKVNLVFPTVLEAPISKGQTIGDIVISIDGETLKKQPVVAQQAIEEMGFFRKLWTKFIEWLTS